VQIQYDERIYYLHLSATYIFQYLKSKKIFIYERVLQII